jgi:hypothetical protein
MSLETEARKIDYLVERAINQEKDILCTAQVVTRVPSKWRLIDLETGEVYQFDDKKPCDGFGNWRKADDIKFSVKK